MGRYRESQVMRVPKPVDLPENKNLEAQFAEGSRTALLRNIVNACCNVLRLAQSVQGSAGVAQCDVPAIARHAWQLCGACVQVRY